ncbi:MAG: endo-1 4-D-glucanase [Candidatus Saganbacteria bacterium]|uniref:Endo-1 4-D-glucanase n=1 Tax=Candidatus Saganbacteria bacterium TaxID=2575572 RepID=A0A833L1P7_UNCSA|nr:MAG: endo-1 4-D-glucanase [Candidatus Saganbacteria bacterium]
MSFTSALKTIGNYPSRLLNNLGIGKGTKAVGLSLGLGLAAACGPEAPKCLETQIMSTSMQSSLDVSANMGQSQGVYSTEMTAQIPEDGSELVNHSYKTAQLVLTLRSDGDKIAIDENGLRITRTASHIPCGDLTVSADLFTGISGVDKDKLMTALRSDGWIDGNTFTAKFTGKRNEFSVKGLDLNDAQRNAVFNVLQRQYGYNCAPFTKVRDIQMIPAGKIKTVVLPKGENPEQYPVGFKMLRARDAEENNIFAVWNRMTVLAPKTKDSKEMVEAEVFQYGDKYIVVFQGRDCTMKDANDPCYSKITYHIVEVKNGVPTFTETQEVSLNPSKQRELKPAFTYFRVTPQGRYFNEGKKEADLNLAEYKWQMMQDESLTFRDMLFGKPGLRGILIGDDGEVDFGRIKNKQIRMKVEAVIEDQRSEKAPIQGPVTLVIQSDGSSFDISKEFYKNGHLRANLKLKFVSIYNTCGELEYLYVIVVGVDIKAKSEACQTTTVADAGEQNSEAAVDAGVVETAPETVGEQNSEAVVDAGVTDGVLAEAKPETAPETLPETRQDTLPEKTPETGQEALPDKTPVKTGSYYTGIYPSMAGYAVQSYTQPQAEQICKDKGYNEFIKLINSNGAVVDPDKGKPTSESQSYGMMLALQNNDRTNFDKIWNWTKANMGSKSFNGLFAWTCNPANCGGERDDNIAPDGDIMMAAALYMAFKRWKDVNYKNAAVTILNALLRFAVDSNDNLMYSPKNQNWFNLSYNMPAFYEMFFELTKDPRWINLIDNFYKLLDKARHQTTYLAPNASDINGKDLGVQSPESARYIHGYDAMRIPFFAAMHAIWFNDPRARTYIDRVASILNAKAFGPVGKGFSLDGTLLDPTQTYTASSFDGSYTGAIIASSRTLPQDKVRLLNSLLSGPVDPNDPYRYFKLAWWTFGCLQVIGRFRAYN